MTVEEACLVSQDCKLLLEEQQSGSSVVHLSKLCTLRRQAAATFASRGPPRESPLFSPMKLLRGSALSPKAVAPEVHQDVFN